MSQTLVLVDLNDLKQLVAENTIANEVWDSKKCAEFLKCSESQVRKQAIAGDLPGVKVGNEWKFSSIAIFEMVYKGGKGNE